MTRAVATMALAIAAHAQTGSTTRGAEIFRTTCSVAYCHGSEGAAARAPQLAGTTLSASELVRVISSGTQRGMPPFGQKLSAPDIEAVAQYIRALPKPATAVAKPVGETPVAPLAGAAEKGRALFFDAARNGGCGSCHELDNRGYTVGPDLRAAGVGRDLRAGSNTRVVTAAPEGEDPFPALIADRTPQRVRTFDLSSPLPVLRTFRADRVRVTPGSRWSHANAVRNYSDADLQLIASYLAAK